MANVTTLAEREGCVYKISFLNSHKVYIGQTLNFKSRRKYHLTELKSGRHYNLELQEIFNKLGLAAIRFEILETCKESDLKTKENEYIQRYDSFNAGLNNLALRGESYITKKTKMVYYYDKKTGEMLGGELGYKGLARVLGIGESNIRQVCSGKMKTAKGYHFSLDLKPPQQVLEDVKNANQTLEYRQKMSKICSGSGNPMYGRKRPELSGKNCMLYKIRMAGYKTPRKILITYEEVIALRKQGLLQREIAKIAGCTQAQIHTILKNSGIKWEPKPIVDLATGVRYRTVKEAWEALNPPYSVSHLRQMLNGDYKNKTTLSKLAV